MLNMMKNVKVPQTVEYHSGRVGIRTSFPPDQSMLPP